MTLSRTALPTHTPIRAMSWVAIHGECLCIRISAKGSRPPRSFPQGAVIPRRQSHRALRKWPSGSDRQVEALCPISMRSRRPGLEGRGRFRVGAGVSASQPRSGTGPRRGGRFQSRLALSRPWVHGVALLRIDVSKGAFCPVKRGHTRHTRLGVLSAFEFVRRLWLFRLLRRSGTRSTDPVPGLTDRNVQIAGCGKSDSPAVSAPAIDSWPTPAPPAESARTLQRGCHCFPNVSR